jgi:hypothetical protein
VGAPARLLDTQLLERVGHDPRRRDHRAGEIPRFTRAALAATQREALLPLRGSGSDPGQADWN